MARWVGVRLVFELGGGGPRADNHPPSGDGYVGTLKLN